MAKKKPFKYFLLIQDYFPDYYLHFQFGVLGWCSGGIIDQIIFTGCTVRIFIQLTFNVRQYITLSRANRAIDQANRTASGQLS